MDARRIYENSTAGDISHPTQDRPDQPGREGDDRRDGNVGFPKPAGLTGPQAEHKNYQSFETKRTLTPGPDKVIMGPVPKLSSTDD